MDSRLRRMAILSCMVVIGLVSALVLYLNKPQEGTGQGISQQGQEAEPGGEANPQGEGRPKGQIGNDLSAFLRDDSFFDQEVNPVLEAARDNASRLSLVVTSVEKDLRIQVVDAQGDGGGLEQTVKALLWLRRTGLWWGEVVIRDRGLDAGGLALARALAG